MYFYKRVLIILFLLLLLPVICVAAEKKSILDHTEEIATEMIKTPFKIVEGVLAFDLGRLVVTPTKYEKPLGDVTVSTSVIDTQDFKRGQFYDASEPLERVNSVRVEKFGRHGQSAFPVIRGVLGNRVLVLIDGIPYNSPSLGGADLSTIRLNKVDRMEIVRGPFSSLYGANAIGGVINIITKGVPEKTKVETSYSYGSWNTHNVTVENGSNWGKLGYLVTADFLSTDGERANSDHNAFDFSSKARLNILDDIAYTFYTNYFNANTEHPGPRPPVDFNNRTVTQRRLGNEDVSSLYDKSNADKIHLNSELKLKNFTANHYFMHWDDDEHRETINFNNNIDRIIDNDEFLTYIYGMEYKYVQPILDIDTITVGSSMSRKVFKVKTDQFNENTGVHTYTGRDAVRREWAVYGENEFRFYPLTVVCGVRYDDPSDYATRWSPKISGMLDLGFDTKLRASYGRAHRAPTLNDINWPQDAFAEGNTNLRPEKTESWEIGLEKMLKDLVLVRATLFRQRIHDAIVWAPTGTRVNLGFMSYARWRPSNLGKLTTTGVELETKISILNKFLINLDYVYIDPVEASSTQSDWANDRLFSESRRIAAYIPKHKFYGGVEWRDPLGIKGLTLNSFLRFVSERRNYYAVYGAADTSITYPKTLLDHYFLWDAKVRYKVKNIEFFLTFDNILDEGYVKFGNTADDRGYPQEGASFTGGVSVIY